jgi:sugar/nucleoside kinase (ribokinase family)
VTSSSLDIVAIGDAIVDVIATCDDAFIEAHGLPKGGMQLLSTEQARALYAAMGPAREISGGSAANSMAGAAARGLATAFVGQVANDQLGTIFAHDMRSLGVRFETPPLDGADGQPTGRCLILVTPDGQRTMNTCPGASHQLRPEALDERLIASTAILMLEGYLWGPELPRRTLVRAIEIARAANGPKIAFTLSESVCLPGRREALTEVIENGGVDLLFMNDHEALQLTGARDLADALGMLSARVSTLVVTRGAQGALGIEDGVKVEVPAASVERIVDTTGAGDLFAAGFLAARCRGRPLKDCLEAGSIAAAEIISHFGARPEADLRELAGL